MKNFLTPARILGLIAIIFPQLLLAGGEEVVVVYNTRVPESKTVAKHYAEKRGVPEEQVVGFSLPTGLEISRRDYRDELEKPLFKKLESLKLWKTDTVEMTDTNGNPVRIKDKVVSSKIRYAVLCYGVPLRITPDPNHQEPGQDKLRPELRRNEACVDSELARLPMLRQELPLAGPAMNPFYATTNAASLHPTNGLLMVARLDGPSASIAQGLVDKAMQAEKDGLWGRAYVDIRGTSDPTMKPGDDWMRVAAEVCRHAGFEVVMDTNENTFAKSFPMSQIGIYIGWYRERVDGPFTLPQVEFMPGAFAYHLHSFNASTLRGDDRNWTGPLLAKGATITMGSVDEPYLAGTPDVGTFAARFILLRFSFGEAAYAGQTVLSWQTTVVGDPLYRPFATPPPQLHFSLEGRGSKLIEWSHLRVVDLNLVRGGTLAECINYLEEIPTTKKSAVLSEKLGNLCAAQGKPSSAISAYQQALELDPSPQQRLRLRLTLGEKLLEADREEDAYKNYAQLAEELPHHPATPDVLRKLIPLAQKLGHKEDAAKFERQLNSPGSGAK